MSTVQEARQCPSCGKQMPAGALAGLCPACLLAQGAETDHGEESVGWRFEPPPIAEVARLFPQFEILDLLGVGGMGAVYKARQPALDRIVALKILPSQNARGVNFVERFNREARALARLNHPNIVAVHEFGQAGALSYFIMEFVDGANLRMLEQGSRLSPREAMQIIPQVCDALQYAHDQGVVHRDIKPENVLIDRKGRVKIADFGLAKILGHDPGAARLTAEGQVMGTPHYMAPEQVERPLAVDHRADIYALGVVFYEMLTGDLPLGKFAPPSRKVQVDVRLDEVVLRALENDPERRYQRASDVKFQVETIAGTPVPSTKPPPLAKQFIRCAGFPLVVVNDGARMIHWKGVLHALAVVFGVLTLAFGVASVAAGRALMDWIGVVGWSSVLARVALAAAAVAGAVRFALRSSGGAASPPQTPQGTAILPREGFSRKASRGAVCLPFAVLAPLAGNLLPDFSAGAISESGWLGILALTYRWLGIGAMLATTTFGWWAVVEIRRSNGRIRGLPLAVLDGLFFPLLALNVALYTAYMVALGVHSFGVILLRLVLSRGLHTIGALAICAAVDFIIVHRVWRALQPGRDAAESAADWWWSQKHGGLTIAFLCLAILGLVGQRRSRPDAFRTPADQIAAPDPSTGVLAARLPNGGIAELLAVAAGNTAPNQWWRPDGTSISDSLFALIEPTFSSLPSVNGTELVFRFSEMPPTVGSSKLDFRPTAIGSGAHRVLVGGKTLEGNWNIKELNNGWGVSAFFPKGTQSGSLRLGFGLGSWQTVLTCDANGREHGRWMLENQTNLQIHVHQISETADGATATVLLGKAASEDWNVRVTALDINGVEHSALYPKQKTESVQTYVIRNVSVAKVREFQVQVNPVHWVEFRGVLLAPRRPVPPPTSLEFGPMREITFSGLIDFDTGRTSDLPPARVDSKYPFTSILDNIRWMRLEGYDAVAASTGLLPRDLLCFPLAGRDWDNLTALDAVQRSYGSLITTELTLPRDAQLPATYCLRTREGSIVLLQLIAIDAGQSRATVRYKLVQSVRAE
jgi:hypothetical protein